MEILIPLKPVLLSLVIIITLLEAPSVVVSNYYKEVGGREGELGLPAPTPLTTIHVFNLLGEGLKFKIHCKSKDDDLGVHVVSQNGVYQWKFHPNYFGTTLFFCDITWRDGSTAYAIYKASRDFRRCSTLCDWDVTKEALLGYTQDPQEQDITVKWTKSIT